MTSESVKETYALIKGMKIRGAGRIARAAAATLGSLAESSKASSARELYEELKSAGEVLKSARPTAVSLPNSVNFVISVAKRNLEKGADLAGMRDAISDAANLFCRTSENAIKTIGSIGAKRVVDGDNVLTHCNSESAISILSTAHRQGKTFDVIVTETRPLMQGRMTASILSRRGLKVTLIPDSAARLYMHKVDKVVVGADAVASNGAVVNKIGTSQLALIAHESRARFYVAAETYKLSPTTMLGELVEIEERSPLEVVPSSWLKQNKKVKVRNPAFDITPPEYIDIIITERGVYPPQGIVLLMKELYPEPDSITL
ncbi:MAG: ribose 1,5-bisphosphate isomerase [Nitrososphaerota archaeon]|jgi:ribose 1,5-bisphosphate isomerase|nr:ribose 1,5-bisphosphate isomerase [Nitrososphaerota archaeon]